jgi:D-3-phosphoglycerate dehydrogenase
MKNLQVDKVDFDEIANSSDFLVILCDLNEKTRGMIDSTFLNKMKSSSYLINLSRGPVVNENHLITSLKQNKISGAGLDVMTNEPIEENNELLNLKNTILTPHSLCWTDECFDSIATEAITSILNYFNNKKIINRVV